MASMTSGGRQAQWSIVKFTDTSTNVPYESFSALTLSVDHRAGIRREGAISLGAACLILMTAYTTKGTFPSARFRPSERPS